MSLTIVALFFTGLCTFIVGLWLGVVTSSRTVTEQMNDALRAECDAVRAQLKLFVDQVGKELKP